MESRCRGWFLGAVVALLALASSAAPASAPPGAADRSGFGGAPCSTHDELRQLLKPYDLVKLNVLGANYCENLLDMRLNATSYTTSVRLTVQRCVAPAVPDDAARYLEAITWEAEYSPVVRLETARRLIKGLLAAHVPGTPSESFFRHRSGGKTFLIFGDPRIRRAGSPIQLGDDTSGALKVGCR